MLRKVLSAALAFLTLYAGASSSLPAAPPYAESGEAVIENQGEHQYKSVKLTPEIYNRSASDLSDLRIKDANGENVPYFINRVRREEYETVAESYPMTLTNSYTMGDSFYFDYRVSDIPDRDVIATSDRKSVV
jgi:hypothetical protein